MPISSGTISGSGVSSSSTTPIITQSEIPGPPTTTSLDVVLQAIEQKLVFDGIFSSNCCWISLNPELLRFPPSDFYAVICPGRQTRNLQIEIGAGRTFFLIFSEIQIELFGRCALDQSNHDDIFLTDPTAGLLPIWLNVINSLENYQPQVNGMSIIPQGYKYVSTDRFSRNFEGGVPGNPKGYVSQGQRVDVNYLGVGYGVLRMNYECQYQLPIAITASTGGG